MKVSKEIKLLAVQCYHRIRPQYDTRKEACMAIAKELGVHWETVDNWTRGMYL